MDVTMKIKQDKNPIFFLDLDETLIETGALVHKKQVEGIIRTLYRNEKIKLSPKLSVNKEKLRELNSEISHYLNKHNLIPTLQKYHTNKKEFFGGDGIRGSYRTFNSDVSARRGTMKVYDDAKEFLEYFGDAPKLIMSNSSQKATELKLDALGLGGFEKVLAAFGDNAKPNTFMGDEGIRYLQQEGVHFDGRTIYVVGDHPIDMKFGSNLQVKHGNYHIKTVFVNRRGLTGVESDYEVKDLGELVERYKDGRM